MQYVAAMISPFAIDKLCQKLDKDASDGEEVEMETLFFSFDVGITGKVLLNYDFVS